MKSVEKSLTKDLHFVFIYRNLSAIQKFKYTWMSFYKMTVAYLESEKKCVKLWANFCFRSLMKKPDMARIQRTLPLWNKSRQLRQSMDGLNVTHDIWSMKSRKVSPILWTNIQKKNWGDLSSFSLFCPVIRTEMAALSSFSILFTLVCRLNILGPKISAWWLQVLEGPIKFLWSKFTKYVVEAQDIFRCKSNLTSFWQLNICQTL